MYIYYFWLLYFTKKFSYKLIKIIIRDFGERGMDPNDIYSIRSLLFKQCDNSISKIYSNIVKIIYDPNTAQSLKLETIKQIQLVAFQIFKYKTALLSSQKDIHCNEQAQINQDKQIDQSKQEIKLLTEDVKSAEIVRKRKLEYNQIAKSVKQFQTNQRLNEKIKTADKQLQNLQNQYKIDMEAYAEKQRCLKIALSALRVLMREQGSAGNGQSPVNLS